MSDESPFGRVRYVPFRNDYSGTIPAFGIVQITGSVSDKGVVTYTVTRPTSGATTNQFAINGSRPVAAGGYGVCTQDLPHRVLIDDSSGSPVFGEIWGPQASSFEAIKSSSGPYQIVGSEYNGTYPVSHAIPSAGGQCYLGLAVSDIEGCLAGVYSEGSYRFCAMTPTVNPTTLTYESLSDTTKRVTAINVSEYKQLASKPALIWKQPNGQYLAYPWQRQFSNAKVNGLTFSGLQVSAWTAAAIDGSHPAATTTSVSGVNKGVFKYGFHGTVIGRMTFTMAASGGGVKTGQATITFGWYQKAAESLGGYTLHYPLVQGPGSDGPSVYDLKFAFSCRLLENAYVDTATIGISGGISSADIGPPECTMEFIANSGMNTPNGFGS